MNNREPENGSRPLASWYSLDPIPLQKVLIRNPDYDFQGLMRSICEGHTGLYLFVPSHCVVIPYPCPKELIEIPEFKSLPSKQTAEPIMTKVLPSEVYPKHEPTVVQIKPDIAARFARELLFNLMTHEIEEVELPGMWLCEDAFIDLGGNPVLVGETPYDTKHWISRLKQEYPEVVKKHPVLSDDITFIRSEIFCTESDDIAVTKQDLLTTTAGAADSENRLANSPTPKEPVLHHPAKDPKHPGYPPELHAALEAWEAVYGNGKEPPKSTGPLIKQWLTENWPQLGSTAKQRIAWVINHAENKNIGTFEEN